MKNPSLKSHAVIGVVGAGAMGRGIIQLFAQAGHQVFFFDQFEGAVAAARDFVVDMVQRSVSKGRINDKEGNSAIDRLFPCNDIKELNACDIVIEAIIEDIDIKRNVFAALEEIVSKDVVLASNTSSLLIAEIAANCKQPERVAGLHFFNPVPLMKVAEIISSVKTSPATVSTLKSVVEGTGHRAVVVADQPGFLINHAGRGLYTEGLRVLEEQVANHNDIDRLMREAAGFRMGPFELLDLTGLDVSGKVMESIYEKFHHEPRFRPSSLVPPRVAAGLYGRKTGEGWYRYENNQRVDFEETPNTTVPEGTKVWVDPTADQAEELRSLVVAAGAALSESNTDNELIVIQPWGIDAGEACVQAGLDARRTAAIDPLPGLDKRRTLMLTSATGPDFRDQGRAIFAADGAAVTVINDSPGFVVQRVLATIINIAANIAQQKIATVEDIEDAVRLGLGYPLGPLAWGDAIGPERVLRILENLQMITGDARYRPSQWLRRRARLGLSLLTAEAIR